MLFDVPTLAAIGALAMAAALLVVRAWLYSILDARTVGSVLVLVVIASVPGRRILEQRRIVLGWSCT